MNHLVLIGLVGFLLGGCDKDVARTESIFLARREAIERPQLWSVQAVGQAGGPIKICTSAQIRTGFIRPTPSLGGQTCRRLGQPVRTAHGWSFRCTFGADTYAVSSAAMGDQTESFQTSFSIMPLQGRGQGVHQTLRYARLGACPTGWEIGQTTDQHGPRRHDAITPLDDTPSPEPAR
jgi:hypothetical protein